MTAWLIFTVAAVAATRGLWSPCGLSMVSSLNPVAERARGHRWGGTAAWYLLGAVAGGAVLGGACAPAALGLGALDPGPRAVAALAGAAALCCLVSDGGLTRWRLPLLPRQVNERWLARYRRWIYAAGFGVQIGTGFATYVMTAATYLTAALAVLTGSPRAALLVGVTFGAVRGAGVLVAGYATTPDRLRALHRRLDALGTPALALCLAAEGLVAMAAAARLGGGAAMAAVALVLTVLAIAGLSRRPRRRPRRVADPMSA